MPNELSESLALVPCCSKPWIWISEPNESRVKKFIRGRSLPTRALPVKGPAKNQLRRTVFFSSHPPEPMIDQRGLSDTGPGNDSYDADIPVGPCTIQEGDILLSTKKITSSDRQ